MAGGENETGAGRVAERRHARGQVARQLVADIEVIDGEVLVSRGEVPVRFPEKCRT